MKISELKRTVLAVILSVVAIAAFAGDKNAVNAVTMVSYEQGLLEDGIIALKNNTDKEIRRVSFRLVYFDMSGNQLDYMDFDKRIDIAPGMTRQIEIEGYGKYREYSYYKSEVSLVDPHRFKISFRLTGYNNTKIVTKQAVNKSVAADTIGVAPSVVGEAPESYDELEFEDEGPLFADGLFMFLFIIIILLTTGISVGLYTIVALLAQKRNRSMVTWVFVGVVATPVLAMIILLCIGDSDDVY